MADVTEVDSAIEFEGSSMEVMPQFGEKVLAICSEIASQMYIPAIFGWVCESQQADRHTKHD